MSFISDFAAPAFAPAIEDFSGDVLTLGGIPFGGYSPPDSMPFGGEQAMEIHKLPGGSRVIDTLGPDEADIEWKGTLFDDAALSFALALDAMRASGEVVPLVFAGQYRSVIIKKFIPRIRRLPVWVEYEICCVVYINPMLGALGGFVGAVANFVGGALTGIAVGPAASIDTLVASDLGSASGAAGADDGGDGD
jgi:hypothetical protein